MPTQFDIAGFGTAAARGVCYSRIGELLQQPDEDLFRQLVDGLYLDELEQVRRSLLAETSTEEADAALERLKEAARQVAEAGFDQLADQFEAAFGHTAATDHPPFEAHYASVHLAQQTHSLADVCGFYRAFGVDLTSDCNERADHIGIEMDFFGLLCIKESNAIKDAAAESKEITQNAQRRFLSQHLGGFAPVLDRCVEKHGRSAFYSAVLHFAVELIEEDFTRLAIPPEERRLHKFVAVPPPSPEDDACFGCSVEEPGNVGPE